MKVKIELPKVFCVSDYHDIYFIESILKEINPKIKTEEVATSCMYWGIIYCGQKPSRKTAEKLLIEAGFDINDEQNRIQW